MEWAQQHFLRVIIQALLKAYQQEFFVTRTVDDLLWGYKDEILSLIHTFRPSISPYFGLYYGVSGFFFSEPLCLAEEVGGARFFFSPFLTIYLLCFVHEKKISLKNIC